MRVKNQRNRKQKSIEKNNKKSSLFEKTNKIDKSLKILIRKNREKTFVILSIESYYSFFRHQVIMC